MQPPHAGTLAVQAFNERPDAPFALPASTATAGLSFRLERHSNSIHRLRAGAIAAAAAPPPSHRRLPSAHIAATALQPPSPACPFSKPVMHSVMQRKCRVRIHWQGLRKRSYVLAGLLPAHAKKSKGGVAASQRHRPRQARRRPLQRIHSPACAVVAQLLRDEAAPPFADPSCPLSLGHARVPVGLVTGSLSSPRAEGSWGREGSFRRRWEGPVGSDRALPRLRAARGVASIAAADLAAVASGRVRRAGSPCRATSAFTSVNLQIAADSCH
jgi:hypothetical protein